MNHMSLNNRAQHQQSETRASSESLCWDPKHFLQYARLRQRPSIELVNRISLEAPQRIYDIGCGPGLATELLTRKWPQADVTGVDSSAHMLQQAASLGLRAKWVHAELESWQPAEPADLLFASAVLHLVERHDALFPRLLTMLRPGGCFAIHMPNWRDSAWYKAIIHVLRSGGFGNCALGPEALYNLVAQRNVFPLDYYYRLLKPLTTELDIWETEHLQIMEGDNPIFDWVSASALLPVLHGLNDVEREFFLSCYMQAVRKHYPTEVNGQTLFPFRRIFIVAKIGSCRNKTRKNS